MSVIDKPQGAIKLSEVSVDTAQPVINTLEREDGMTVIERLRRLVTDSFRRNTVLLTSSASVTWSGGTLQIPDGVSISLALLAAPDSASASFNTITYTSSGVTNWSIANGDVLYIELERSLLDASGSIVLTDGINAAGTIGRRIRKSPPDPIPFINDPNDGSPQGTLMIPVAVRFDDASSTKKNLWWMPHGLLWSENIQGILGRLSTTTTIPIGGIIPIHIPSITDIGVGPSQAVIDLYAPGFWLCDGSLINNLSSPLYNQNSPNLNQPVSYQAATISDYNPKDLGGNRFLKGGTNSSVATSNNNDASVGGKSAVVLSALTIPSHTHTVGNSSYGPGGFHSHSQIKLGNPDVGLQVALMDNHDSSNHNLWDTNSSADGPSALKASGILDDSHNHTVESKGGTGAGISPYAAAHQNQPPYFDAVYIIRVV